MNKFGDKNFLFHSEIINIYCPIYRTLGTYGIFCGDQDAFITTLERNAKQLTPRVSLHFWLHISVLLIQPLL